jgi:hypothetical protein
MKFGFASFSCPVQLELGVCDRQNLMQVINKVVHTELGFQVLLNLFEIAATL